jgi:hypothetical protein
MTAPASGDTCDILKDPAFCDYPDNTSCECLGKSDGSGAAWTCGPADGGAPDVTLSCPSIPPANGSYCSLLSDESYCGYPPASPQTMCMCFSTDGTTNGMWSCFTIGPPTDGGGPTDAGVDTPADTRPDAGADLRVDMRVDSRG